MLSMEKKKIQESLQKSGLSHVYLASDTSGDERKELLSAFNTSQHATLQFVGVGGADVPVGLSEAQTAVLDQVIYIYIYTYMYTHIQIHRHIDE